MKLWKKLSIICSVVLILTVSISGFLIINKAKANLLDKERELGITELENLIDDFEQEIDSQDIIWGWDLRRNAMIKYVFEEMGYSNAVLMDRTDNFILYSNYDFAPNEYLALQFPEDCYFMDFSTCIGEIQGQKYLLVGRIPESISTSSSGSDERSIEDYSIYLIKDLSETYEDIEVLTYTYVIVCGLTILIGLFVIIFGVRYSTKHLQKLNVVTQEIAKGNYEQRIEIDTRDEVAELGSNMNVMAAKIQTSIAELQEQIQRQKLFIGAISHEYKTPLTGLLLHLELLSTLELDNEGKEKSLEHMMNQCHYLEEITRKLTRIITMEKELNIRNIPMKSFVEEIHTQVQPLLEEKRIALKTYCEVEEMEIDEVLIQLAIVNMIHNACKASDIGGIIKLYVRENLIEVEDYGIGIEADELERIKEPFYVVDKARNKKISGTGIGLAIVNEVASLHGGTLCIRSQVDAGTTVTIRLH